MQLSPIQITLFNTIWPAPAKLNLFLHILGRYQNGPFQSYHQIQSVMQSLSFGDSLHFSFSAQPEVSLEISGSDLSCTDNLILRAATLLQQVALTQGLQPFGVHIHLEKRIPIGGGLGGGSSDAATTLLILNAIWALDLSLDQLAELGLKLGADVPFFIRGENAFVAGIGEQLTPIQLSQPWFLVIHPGVSVDTRRVYQHPGLTRNTPAVTMAHYADGLGHNDCELVVFQDYPEVAKAQTWLAQFTTSQMTGSGACIFGRFDSEAAALAVLAQLPTAWHGFVAQGQHRSRLHTLLDQIQTSHIGV